MPRLWDEGDHPHAGLSGDPKRLRFCLQETKPDSPCVSVFARVCKQVGVADGLGYNRQKPVRPGLSTMGTSKTQPSSNPSEPSADRLDSWKEIAAYLKRDERTVRRWEQEGLPVHRHVHKKQASVYAYKAEVDAWWNTGRQRLESSPLSVLPP